LLLENLTAVVLWVLAAILAVDFIIIGAVIGRRFARSRYFRQKDAARERFRPHVQAFAARTAPPDLTLHALAAGRSRAAVDAVEELLLEVATDDSVPRVASLFFHLRYVDRWAARAFGRKRGAELVYGFRHQERRRRPRPGRPRWLLAILRLRVFSVKRALAVEKLGRLAPDHVLGFCSEALLDPAADVRRSAINALASTRDSQAVPLLLDELRKSVDGSNDVALRTTRAAVVACRPAGMCELLPLLADERPRMRFFIVDTIRELLSAPDAPPPPPDDACEGGFWSVMLQAVHDTFEDVRARSAAVLRHLRSPRGRQALRRLLEDPNEFVRLHAVRACAADKDPGLVPDVKLRIFDSFWRVREAAARALLQMGPEGEAELYACYIRSQDRYANEQMTEEMQRAGAVRELVYALAGTSENAPLARMVCRKLAELGCTQQLQSALLDARTPAQARIALLTMLAARRNAAIEGAMRKLVRSENAEVAAAAALLLESQPEPQAVAT